MAAPFRLMTVTTVLICLLGTSAAWAGNARHLADVLRIGEVIEVLRDEGLDFGADLDRDMLAGQGGAFWAQQVGWIYDRVRMQDTVRVAMSQGMSDDEIARSLEFFDTDLGQQILSLETSARLEIGRASCGKECRSRWSPYH